MEKSKISFQIDECLIKAVRNESERRRDRSMNEQDQYENDYKQEFQRLGLISDEDKTEPIMKKNVVRILIRK